MPNRFGGKGLLSDDSRPIVRLEENGMTYIGLNKNRRRILRYSVDGGLISSATKRCDKAAYLPADQNLKKSEVVYLVELKGSDLKKAAQQISQTIITLGHLLDGCEVHGRAICTRIPTPDIRSSEIIKLERDLAKMNGTFRKSSTVLNEEIGN